MIELVAKQDFIEACSEIQTLRSLLVGPDGKPCVDRQTEGVVIRSALVLLCSKFEAYCESAVQEWIYYLNQTVVISDHLPLRPLLEHSAIQIERINEHLRHEPSHFKAVAMFRDLSRLWCENRTPTELAPPVSFSYGKHGRKELIKLWKRVGLVGLVEEFSFEFGEESYIGDKAKINFLGEFDSLVNKRNQIVHGDSAMHITPEELDKYFALLMAFGDHAEEYVKTQLGRLQCDCGILEQVFNNS